MISFSIRYTKYDRSVKNGRQVKKRSSFHVRLVDDAGNHIESVLESHALSSTNRDVVGLILANRHHKTCHSSLHCISTRRKCRTHCLVGRDRFLRREVLRNDPWLHEPGSQEKEERPT